MGIENLQSKKASVELLQIAAGVTSFSVPVVVAIDAKLKIIPVPETYRPIFYLSLTLAILVSSLLEFSLATGSN